MIGLSVRAPLPVAFVPPVVAVPAANAIVPFVLPSSGALVAGPAAAVGSVAAGAAIVAGAPIIASLALGFGAGVLIGAAALEIAQLWGVLNGKPRKTNWVELNAPGSNINVSGSYSPTGSTTVSAAAATWIGDNPLNNCAPYSVAASAGTTTTITGGIGKVSFQGQNWTQNCGGTHRPRIIVNRKSDNQPFTIVSNNFTVGGLKGWTGTLVFSTNAADALPAAQPELPPLPNRPSIAKAFVTPDAIPQPLPLPLPGTEDPARAPEFVPTVPESEPVTQPQPQPAPGQTPVTAPPLPRAPVYSPQSPTQTQQTTQAGTLVAPAPTPVPTTDPEAHYPYPGSGPITGQGVRPDLEAIAKEVGRIEQKVASLMNTDGPVANVPWLLLYNLLQDIWTALTDGAPADTYTLSSPCVKDENGDRIVSEVQIPQTSDNWTRITARVDALAQLLQVHKDLKQPSCQHSDVEVGGEFVTVNFEQID